MEVMNRKMGPDQVPRVLARLNQLGQQEGIDFRFGGMTGNTRDAHRLIHLSSRSTTKGASQEVHNRLVEKLFSAYFEQEKDIRNVEVLKQLGVEAGLDAAEVKKWMDSDLGGKEVDDQASRARRLLHVSGVPTFLVQDGEYRLEGAQDAQDFLDVFGKVKGSET
jgi:predicted DsbA family dithiol-disulfide isomerase